MSLSLLYVSPLRNLVSANYRINNKHTFVFMARRERTAYSLPLMIRSGCAKLIKNR